MNATSNEARLTNVGGTARECPFCGGRKVFLIEMTDEVGRYYNVCCVECSGSVTRHFRHPWEAIDAWNGGAGGRYCDRDHDTVADS